MGPVADCEPNEDEEEAPKRGCEEVWLPKSPVGAAEVEPNPLPPEGPKAAAVEPNPPAAGAAEANTAGYPPLGGGWEPNPPPVPNPAGLLNPPVLDAPVAANPVAGAVAPKPLPVNPPMALILPAPEAEGPKPNPLLTGAVVVALADALEKSPTGAGEEDEGVLAPPPEKRPTGAGLPEVGVPKPDGVGVAALATCAALNAATAFVGAGAAIVAAVVPKEKPEPFLGAGTEVEPPNTDVVDETGLLPVTRSDLKVEVPKPDTGAAAGEAEGEGKVAENLPGEAVAVVLFAGGATLLELDLSKPKLVAVEPGAAAEPKDVFAPNGVVTDAGVGVGVAAEEADAVLESPNLGLAVVEAGAALSAGAGEAVEGAVTEEGVFWNMFENPVFFSPGCGRAAGVMPEDVPKRGLVAVADAAGAVAESVLESAAGFGVSVLLESPNEGFLGADASAEVEEASDDGLSAVGAEAAGLAENNDFGASAGLAPVS